jgi:hypothetical protein
VRIIERRKTFTQQHGGRPAFKIRYCNVLADGGGADNFLHLLSQQVPQFLRERKIGFQEQNFYRLVRSLLFVVRSRHPENARGIGRNRIVF